MSTQTERTLTLTAVPLTAENWAPFGQIPVKDTEPVDPVRLEFTRGDPHFNFIGHFWTELDVEDGAPICDLLNRHDTHTQTLMSIDVDGMLVVAPKEVDFSDPAHVETMRAFVIHPLQALSLELGTWHWGPFPLGPGEITMANVQGKGYATDNAIAYVRRDLGVRCPVVWDPTDYSVPPN